jgi:hypothetical protein
VNLGLDENSKLNDCKKYHKQVQNFKTSRGQCVGTDQQEAKAMLKDPKKNLRCIICNRAFISRQGMLLHMHNKHAGLFIVCKHNGICSKMFHTEAEKSEHIREVTNRSIDLMMKCNFCGLIYCKGDKANHFKKHHKNDFLFRCSYGNCSTRFLSEVEKQNHEALVHTSTKKDKCIFCNKFVYVCNILRHYQTKHKTPFANAFKCKFKCRRYFRTEADLKEHIASAHKKIIVVRADAKCLYCNKVFIDKYGLNIHVNKHHSAVKVICKFFTCGQYFRTQTEADEHFEQQHQKIEENKKYRCFKCNFRAALKINVKYHIYRMHGEKMLQCPKCTKCFISSIILKEHLKRMHLPLKVNVCPHCNKSILNIRNHLKQEKCKRCQKVLLCLGLAHLHKKLCKL